MNIIEENIAADDKCYKKCQFLESFFEYEEVLKIIKEIPFMTNNASERNLERFIYVIDQYQAQPHLLDSHLESMLGALLDIIKQENISMYAFHLAFKFLYHITKTRGYKVIVRMMPHDVREMKPLLAFLKREDPTNPETWQTRYMLLLWLAIVCMVPFDLDKFDETKADLSDELSTMDQIISLGKKYLSTSDKSQDAATFLLARIFTRPDVKNLRLEGFVLWVGDVLVSFDSNDNLSVTLLLGTMRFIALLFKFSRREDVLQHGINILSILMRMDLQSTSAVSVIRKLFIKAIRRIGLQFLKYNVPKWRYKRGLRNLQDNLSTVKTGPEYDVMEHKKDDEDDDDEGSYDIPEQIEEIIEKLLLGLQDKDSVVRWSSAKGVGQITGRLPKSLADEVVESVLSLFTPNQTEAAWHGGCLCLGDLGCRGLLLPYRLKQVVPIIVKALVFEEHRGNFSVGSIVRDSACYVCWSFARAYNVQDIKEYVDDIAKALLVASLFDRDVTVRRAAAAAFQENVGRQGSFAHGIDIITTCDYFAVGNRTNCYLELSDFVGQFEEYKFALIDHIIDYKLCHWDSALRELAGGALHVLTARNITYVTNTVLKSVLKRCISREITARHGHIVATGQLTYGVFKYYGNLETALDEDIINDLISLPEELILNNFFKGVNADMTRRAVCIFIEKMSLSNLNIKLDSTLKAWRAIIDESLQGLDESVQSSAVSSMSMFSKRYFFTDSNNKSKDVQCQLSAMELVDNYCKLLRSSETSMKALCGYCCTLSALSPNILAAFFGTILNSLLDTVAPKVPIEARRDAIKAIGNICTTVEASNVSTCLTENNIFLVYTCLFRSMSDYSVDGRGDVGSWVREASLEAMYKVTILLVSQMPNLVTEDIVQQLFCIIVQQSMEKINRMRLKAIQCFYKLLHNKPPVPHIMCRKELLRLFPVDLDADNINWDDMMRMLSLPAYSYYALTGLVVSVGGLSESLTKQSSDSLLSFLAKYKAGSEVRKIFDENLIKILKNFAKNERIIFPYFIMMDLLLNHSVFVFTGEEEKEKFFSDMFQLMKKETERTRDVQKILSAINVFCGMLDVASESLRGKILERLMVLLCHPFPKVRHHTATMLYSATLASEWIAEDILDEFTAIITVTKWEDPIETLRPLRNQLCELLKLPIPVVKKL